MVVEDTVTVEEAVVHGGVEGVVNGVWGVGVVEMGVKGMVPIPPVPQGGLTL